MKNHQVYTITRPYSIHNVRVRVGSITHNLTLAKVAHGKENMLRVLDVTEGELAVQRLDDHYYIEDSSMEVHDL